MSAQQADNKLVDIMPWHEEKWSSLLGQLQQGRLPHSLLLSGLPGVGKSLFAESLARKLLCKQSDGDKACGDCRDCHLLKAGSHPDLLLALPEEAGKQIKVDQIRRLIDFAAKTAQQGGRRVVVINPAGAMNKNAANSLLKVLEEPGEDTYLLLVNQGLAGILPTIRSRCQIHILPAPQPEEALQWLADCLPVTGERLQKLLVAADGQPLQALLLEQNGLMEQREGVLESLQAMGHGKAGPVEVAERWTKTDTSEVITWLYGWLTDLVRWKQTQEPEYLRDKEALAWYRVLASAASAEQIHRLHNDLHTALAQSKSTTNPNKQLLLEGVAIKWQRCFGAVAA
jgi:DNA polymerase-3 subunit delta'